MNKTIICNRGTSDKGKSASVKRTRQLILDTFPDATERTFVLNGDIKVIITIGDLFIGIESEGDPNSRLTRERLRDFVPECQIILCTSRTKGEPFEVVREVARMNSYRLFWVTNHRNNNQSRSDENKQLNRELNQQSAESFLQLIQSIIRGL
jgi:hypothetical protein